MNIKISTPKNIIFLGLVSFFADISSEMVYPLIPLFLTSAFGATPVFVGIVEGIAESVASLLKVFSGHISDIYQRKKALAFSGYACGLIYKVLLLLATSWLGVLLARVIDRFGKGIRTAPRDVLVAESAHSDQRGKAFGVHKAMDMAGSAIGIMLAYVILSYNAADYTLIFALAIIPALLSLAVFPLIRERRENRMQTAKRPSFIKNLKLLHPSLKLYLALSFFFTLGNSSNAFLLLKSMDMGYSSNEVILLYFLYNVVASLLAIPFGGLSDNLGRKRLLVLSYALFGVVYAIFAFAVAKWMILAAFGLYGCYTAMVSGVERAFIAEIAPPALKGTMLGLQATIVGVALLPASVIAGFLWVELGAYAPFLLGAVLSTGAAIVLGLFFKPKPAQMESGQG